MEVVCASSLATAPAKAACVQPRGEVAVQQGAAQAVGALGAVPRTGDVRSPHK